MRVEFDAGASEKLAALVDHALDRLGPMVADEVRRNTPRDTGALVESVEDIVDRGAHKLYIQAYGDDLREADNRKYYAAYVDLGHRLIAWGHDTGRVIAPTAFMRRALYRRYPGF